MQIEKFQKGDTQRTALHTAAANEIADAVNKLFPPNIKVSPEGTGEFVESDGNYVLKIICPSAGSPSGATMTFRVSVTGSAENVDITSAEVV